MRFKATIEVTNTYSVTLYATSEEEAHEEVGSMELYDLTEDLLTNSSIKVLDLESDGF
jgi:hypothetical protein